MGDESKLMLDLETRTLESQNHPAPVDFLLGERHLKGAGTEQFQKGHRRAIDSTHFLIDE
jgi:hypothetical protein